MWRQCCLKSGATLSNSPPPPSPQPRAVECTNSLGEWLMPKWGSEVLIPWAGGEMLILRARRGWSGECAPTRIIGPDALDRGCFVFYDSGGGVGAHGWREEGLVGGARLRAKPGGGSEHPQVLRTDSLYPSQTRSPPWHLSPTLAGPG